ncbi:hypothetical protein IFVP203_C1200004 [Vibrio parahaemolyticus]
MRTSKKLRKVSIINNMKISQRVRSYNKAFKSDSPRLAFLAWVKFSDYGAKIGFRGRVAHTLMRRYVAGENL